MRSEEVTTMTTESVTTAATENRPAINGGVGPAGTPAPQSLRLERGIDGQLWARTGGREVRVKVHRCFPWTEPGRFVSLRDADDEEVALVRNADELDPGSRAALEDALAEAGFVLEVTRIHAVEEEVEIRCWRVETRQGPRSFQTRRDDWPREVSDSGFLIRDVSGDLYHVRDTSALDRESREWLWAYVE